MPKVFISYSYDDDTHIAWVSDLASKLRANGVDVIFDQFETRLGSDLPLFMEQGLSKSSRVICICSDTFNQKANSGRAGVYYEKRIICNELVGDSSSAWVIPLIRNNKSQKKLPTFLSALKYISFEDDGKFKENFYDLLRDLHDQNSLPPLGGNPFEHNPDVLGKIDETIQISKTLSITKKSNGTDTFNYLSNSGNYTVGTGLYEFKTHWSTASNHSVHAYNDHVRAIACTSNEIDINNFNLEEYDFSSRARTANIGESVIWINNNGKILVTKIEKISIENTQKNWLTITYQTLENAA
ncbi:MAG: toll/interleukin-1 receptor domain-containing protein [Nitrosomonas sp.]|nr:toll/interleukin-1 receptor domain-containing protein [Nitrosomonas sp.]MBP7112966.1 toll/interleukin-1 receptor domain-containing protein [Nitrosomonas sp.]